MSDPRYLIIADGDFSPMTSKTANSIIRYHPERTVAVLDRQQAGQTVQDVLGFGGAIPVVGSMREGLARGPSAVLIGMWRVSEKSSLMLGTCVTFDSALCASEAWHW